MSFIVKAVSAFPEHVYKQSDIIRLLRRLWPDKTEQIEKFGSHTHVEKRHLSLPLSSYRELGDMGKRNLHWKNVALSLQEKNIEHLLSDHSFDLSEIELLSSATTTGLCVPSLEALMMNQFSFSPHTKRLPIFGLGCLAGVAGINRVDDYLQGHPKSSAILMVTELCSLTFQFKDMSFANLIGSSLFGDAAAAVFLVGNDHPLARKGEFEILSTESVFYTDTERLMGWDMIESGFQIVLSEEIPHLIRDHVGKNMNEFLERNQLRLSDIKFFVAHPGGPKILETMAETIQRSSKEFELSWKALKERGNTSAASVLNILEMTMQRKDIKKNDLGLMFAMGPAFSLELTLVRKCQ